MSVNVLIKIGGNETGRAVTFECVCQMVALKLLSYLALARKAAFVFGEGAVNWREFYCLYYNEYDCMKKIFEVIVVVVFCVRTRYRM